MKGQLDFDGFEIQADTIKLPGIGMVPLTNVKADRDVHPGDAFEIRLRCYIGAPAFATSGMDGRGNFKGEFDRHFTAYADHQEYEVTRYITKAERDAMWAQEHGAA